MAACALLLLASAMGVGMKLIMQQQAAVRMEALQTSMVEPAVELITIRLAEDALVQNISTEPAPTLLPVMEAVASVSAPVAHATAQRQEKLAALQKENPEFVGWMTLPGTQIDYPIMQSPSRRWYYLDHDFAHGYSKGGLPFIEESCNLSGNRANWIIYGHNMKNGSMFGGLHKLAVEQFYQSHRDISFDTPERTGQYRIVSVFYTVIDPGAAFQFYFWPNLTTAADFDRYAQNILDASLYPADETLAWGDELLTLVTCSKHAEDGRLIVVAKRQ